MEGESNLMQRCRNAEETLRKETEANERHRVEVQMLKDAIEKGVKAFGVHFHQSKN